MFDFGGTTGKQAVFFGTDVRQYWYDRTRFGFAGSADYKLGPNSIAYVRGLFSQFYDNGDNWNYSITTGAFDGGTPSTPDATGSIGMNHFHRTPQQQIYSLSAGANHNFGATLITYDFSYGRAAYDGGFPFAIWSGPQNVQFGVDTSHPFTPKFPVLNGVNLYDPTQYSLFAVLPWNDHIAERDFSGSLTLTRQYIVHSHFGAFEVGVSAHPGGRTSQLSDTPRAWHSSRRFSP